MDLVKQARDLLDGTTPEPWHVEDEWNVGTRRKTVVSGSIMIVSDDESAANASFIAASRDLVPAMADRIEALEAALRDADGHLTNLQPHIPQACYPGQEGFIDAHVDEAIRVIRAALEGK